MHNHAVLKTVMRFFLTTAFCLSTIHALSEDITSSNFERHDQVITPKQGKSRHQDETNLLKAPNVNIISRYPLNQIREVENVEMELTVSADPYFCEMNTKYDLVEIYIAQITQFPEYGDVVVQADQTGKLAANIGTDQLWLEGNCQIQKPLYKKIDIITHGPGIYIIRALLPRDYEKVDALVGLEVSVNIKVWVDGVLFDESNSLTDNYKTVEWVFKHSP